MSRSIIYFVIFISLLTSCNNNTAEKSKNDLAINPAIIAQMDTANYTTIEWEDTVRNFGIVREGDSVFVKFKFKNSGEKALFVTAAHSSCGCATVKYSEKAVLPGENGDITAAFKNKYKPGFIHQTIIVTTNTSNKKYHTLSFEGEVADSVGVR